MKTSALLFILFAALNLPASAQTNKFVRVRGVSDLDISKNYLIASSHNAPRFFLGCNGVKNNSKLAAKEADVSGDTLEISDISLFWKISQANGMYTISSASNGKHIAAGKNPADLTTGAEPIEWVLSDNGGAICCACGTGDGTRYLSCDTVYNYFGRFADRNIYGDLVFYKNVSASCDNDSSDVPVSSADECCLVAYANNRIYSASARIGDNSYLGFSDVSLCELSDGKFSMWNKNLRWKTKNNADGTFLLLTSEDKCIAPDSNDGEFVKVNSVTREASALFRLKNGFVVTQATDGSELYLAFRASASGSGAFFCFARQEHVDETTLFGVRIRNLAEIGTFISDDNGLKTLRGGFDTEMLARALEETTTSLDLRNIVLPKTIRDFDMSDATNCIIYIRGDMLADIPASWRNVVACDVSGVGHLKRVMLIDDNAAFHAAYPFTAGKDSLTYSRDIPQTGWSSLCLPFDAEAVSQDITLYGIDKIEDSEIKLSERTEAKAFQPYLMRCSEQGEGLSTVVLTASQGYVPATETRLHEENRLAGTLKRKDVESEDDNVFLLSADGFRFVKAAAGSYLNPFRCYLKPDNIASKSLCLTDGGVTGIDHVKKHYNNIIYNTEGVFMGEAGEESIGNMPLCPGIYIVKGRKIIKKK